MTYFILVTPCSMLMIGKIFEKIKINSPELIVFNNLTAGQNPTYDALQNFTTLQYPIGFTI